MGDYAPLVWAGCVGFWLGFSCRFWGERMAAKNPPYVPGSKMASFFITTAESIKRTRQFVGGGMSITNTSVWSVGHLGDFRVVIEEASPPQPDHEQAGESHG